MLGQKKDDGKNLKAVLMGQGRVEAGTTGTNQADTPNINDSGGESGNTEAKAADDKKSD